MYMLMAISCMKKEDYSSHAWTVNNDSTCMHRQMNKDVATATFSHAVF